MLIFHFNFSLFIFSLYDIIYTCASKLLPSTESLYSPFHLPQPPPTTPLLFLSAVKLHQQLCTL